MKTLKLKNRKTRNGISLLIAVMLPLFILVSCQKSENLFPTVTQITKSSERLSNQIRTPFTKIKIDHHALRSNMPDYMVTVLSNGRVIFEGRRNVTVLGQRYFDVPKSTLLILEEIFRAEKFYDIQSHLMLNPDEPYVLTSFSMHEYGKIKTHADDNSKPESLIRIRTAVENILEIQRFVNLKLPGDANQAL